MRRREPIEPHGFYYLTANSISQALSEYESPDLYPKHEKIGVILYDYFKWTEKYVHWVLAERGDDRTGVIDELQEVRRCAGLRARRAAIEHVEFQ